MLWLAAMRSTCLLAAIVLLTGCSPARMGMNRMADALSATAAAYARDDDPELVRTGAPATLKMVEMLLDSQPSHPGLLMTACSGFAQYAYGFLHVDSEILAASDPRAAQTARERAIRMYLRARGYCLRELAVRHPQLAEALTRQPRTALPMVAATAKADVPALFWTAVTWAGELSLADNQILRIGELAVVRALLARALGLDESWAGGTIHEAMIALEGLPALLGGSAARARTHFDRAVALSNGQSAFAFVTYATSVAAPGRDRALFDKLLKQALAIDPARTPALRLANLIAQKRARFLQITANQLFK